MYVQLRTTVYFKQPHSYAELFLHKSLSQHLAPRLYNTADFNTDLLDVVSLMEISLINEASSLLPSALLHHPLSSHLHSPSTSAFVLFARLYEISAHVSDAVLVAEPTGLSDLIGNELQQICNLEQCSRPLVELVFSGSSSTNSRTTSADTPSFVSYSEYLELAFTEWRFRLVIFRTVLEWTMANGASLLTSVRCR